MISWIQKYFQRHFKVVFFILLVGSAIPLVMVFNPSSGIGRGDRQVKDNWVFGYNLASQTDKARLYSEARVSAELQYGYVASDDELTDFAYQRAASLQLANQLHIPPATAAEITAHIKGLRTFAGQNGEFDAAHYNQFRDTLKKNTAGFNEGTVSKVLSDDVRIAKVQKLIGGPGYVLPADIKTELAQADSTWTLGVATVDYDSYKPNIPVTEKVLTDFYKDNSFRYQIQPRVVVSYADFSAVPLVPTIQVTDAELRAAYYANPARFPKPPVDPKAPKPAANKPEDAFEAVRDQVETSVKVEKARRLALKEAADFRYDLYNQKLVPGTPPFTAYLAEKKIQLKTLAPFTRNGGPAELGTSPDIAAAAFRLDKERPISDALDAPAGAVVLFWKETLPATVPPYAEVKDKVRTDYLESEKSKRFVELGRVVRGLIESRLKAGDKFEQAVADAARAESVKIEAKMHAPFTRRQPPQDLDASVMGALDRLDKGGVSDMAIVRGKGYLVYAGDKKLPDLSPTNPKYKQIDSQLAYASAGLGVRSYLNDLVTAETKKSEANE